jgi:transposase
MKDQVIDYDVGALDATTLQVLNEPGRPATRKSYVYLFRGGVPGKEAVLYEYNATDHKHFVNDWFAGFKGTLHCDCDPFFDFLFTPSGVNPSFCNTHARHKFEPIANAAQGNSLAKQAMAFYKRITILRSRRLNLLSLLGRTLCLPVQSMAQKPCAYISV